MNMPPVRMQGTALLLEQQVHPGAAGYGIVALHGVPLKVRISPPPVDGRANQHLMEFLARSFDVPRARVVLLRGESGRSKSVRVEAPGRIPEEIRALMG